MNILLLDNYDSFTHNLFHALHKIGATQVDVFRNDKISLDEVGRYDRILLSPGPGIPAEAGIMPELITRYKDQKNILGVCLGHQAIAEAFGGSLFNMKPVMHGKESEIVLEPGVDSMFQNLPESIVVGRYHSWAVDEGSLPDCLMVSARDKSGQIMGLKHKDLPLRGVQFHPESIMTPQGEQMLTNWLEL